MYDVKFRKKITKQITKLPKSEQNKFAILLDNLRANGPNQPDWPNFSKLEKNKYHCHLSYSWVACWEHEKNTIIIEVYYAGSRENAPY